MWTSYQNDQGFFFIWSDRRRGCTPSCGGDWRDQSVFGDGEFKTGDRASFSAAGGGSTRQSGEKFCTLLGVAWIEATSDVSFFGIYTP